MTNLEKLSSLAKAADKDVIEYEWLELDFCDPFSNDPTTQYLRAANPTVIIELINRLREAESVIKSIQCWCHENPELTHEHSCDWPEANAYLNRHRGDESK